MKAGHVVTLALLTASGLVQAQNKCAVFYEQGEPTQYITASMLDSAVFDAGGSVLAFHLNDSRQARIATQGIDSICFKSNVNGATALPYATQTLKGMFSKTDVPQYSESAEPAYNSFKDGDEYYNDYFENYKVEKNVSIVFNGSSVTIPASLPKNVTITRNGAHVTVKCGKGHVRFSLSGSTTNGSFTLMSVGEDDKKCHIQLAGVSIQNPSGPAINIQSGKTVYLSLLQGKDNSLKDGDTYSIVEGQDRKATLFSEGQIIINGAGNLSVTSKGGHAICSDDYIRIRSGAGRIELVSDKDGINTKDKFMMWGGNVNITAKSNGIQVRRGHAEIYGGKLVVNSVNDGIKVDYLAADTAYLNITGGYQRIETTGVKGHAINVTGPVSIQAGATAMLKASGLGSKCLKSDSSIRIAQSSLYLMDTAQNLSETDETAKSRAMSGAGIEIGKASRIYIYAAKTGIHSTAGLTILGGQTLIEGVDASKCLNISTTTTQRAGLMVTGLAE